MPRESLIQIHRTEAVGATPTGLTAGELAVNLTDQILFVGLSSGGYITFGATGAANTFTKKQTFNSDVLYAGTNSGVTFSGMVTTTQYGLYKNPDQYNLTTGVSGNFDYTKGIVSSIDFAIRAGGKAAKLIGANQPQINDPNGNLTVIDIDSVTAAGMHIAPIYGGANAGAILGLYLGANIGLPPLVYRNAPGYTAGVDVIPPSSASCLMIENINSDFEAFGLDSRLIPTPYRTVLQYATWVDADQSLAANGVRTFNATIDKWVRTGFIIRGGSGSYGGPTGSAYNRSLGATSGVVWSNWKNLVETVDDLTKFGVASWNGSTGSVLYSPNIASYGVTGVAAFDPRFFGIGATGYVTLTGSYQVTGDTINASGPSQLVFRTGNMVNIDNRVATTGVTGVAAFNSTFFSVNNAGSVSLTTPYSTTGDTINASGPSQLVFRTGNMVNIDNRVATTGVTGVAAFTSTQFSVTPGGVVSLTTPYTITGDTINASGPSQLVFRTGNMVNIDNRVATTGVTGVAAFNSTNFSVTPGGVVSLTTPYTITGDTINASGPSQLVFRTGNMVNIDNRVATTGVTGVAAFSSTNFSVTPGGVVSLTTAYSTTGDTINASGPSQLVFRTGNMVNLDNRVATTGVTGVAAFSSTQFSVTPGGVVSLTTPYTITGDTVSLSGPALLLYRTGNMVNLDARVATTGVTGVASFPSTYFSVGTNGAVTPTNITVSNGNSIGIGGGTVTLGGTVTISNTGVTGIGFGGDYGLTGKINLTAGSGTTITYNGNLITIASSSSSGVTGDTINASGPSQLVFRTGNMVNIDNRVATTGVTGVAAFSSTNFSVTPGGVVSLTTPYTITGDTINASGPSQLVFRTGNMVNLDVRVATTGVTGVASFPSTYFSVGTNGAVTPTNITVSNGNSIGIGGGTVTLGGTVTISNTGVTGIGFGGDYGLTGKINLTAGSGVTITRSNNQITIASSGSGGVTGDTVWGDGSAFVGAGSTSGAIWTGGYVAGTNNKKLTARLTTTVLVDGNGVPEGMPNYTGVYANGLAAVYSSNELSYEHGKTGVGYFDDAAFFVNSKYGLVRLRGSFFASPGSGLSAGTSGDDAAIDGVSLDISNLSAATTALDSTQDYILYYDASSNTTKKMVPQQFLLDQASLFTIDTDTPATIQASEYIPAPLLAPQIKFTIPAGTISASATGFARANSVYSYVVANTVASANGCTGALTITGTVNEIEVLKSCPTLTIGLPNNVSIPYLSVTGATFAQTVTANLFVGTVSGGDF